MPPSPRRAAPTRDDGERRSTPGDRMRGAPGRDGETVVTIAREVASAGDLRLIARRPDLPQRPLDLVERLERMAAATPDAPAVSLPGGHVSYAALAATTRALAARLRGDPETPVVVLSDFTPRYCAAQIACLRAGRPFVPVDPAISPLRLAQIVLQSGTDVVVLGDGASLSAMDPLPRFRTIAFDALEPDGPAIDRSATFGSRPSFIVYTSGSTGISKGVPQTNEFLASFLTVEAAEMDARPGDRIAVLTPPGVLVGPIYAPLPLFAGARLVMAPDLLDATALIALIARERVTQLCCYVGLARALCGHPGARAAFGAVRALQVFGDIVGAADCAAMRAALPPSADILLAYGSTESVQMAAWKPPHGIVGDGDRIPLGAPAPGMELWLRPDPAADGSDPEGELLVAGPRVTRGYWRDEAATRPRLVPHPHEDGRFLFAVGDLVRLRPDGMLEFRGRADNQVKLRGWRIELEEIETFARRVPGVEQAAVVPRRRATGIVESLALHVVGSAPPASVLAALRETLPEAMVPTTALAVASLPSTATGKIDRVRLAEVDRQMQEAAAPYVAPADEAWPDPIAARIAAILCEETGHSPASPDIPINEIGFDSLQAVSIALRIEKQFAVSIVPDLLLSDRTARDVVAEIAAEARRAGPR